MISNAERNLDGLWFVSWSRFLMSSTGTHYEAVAQVISDQRVQSETSVGQSTISSALFCYIDG